MKIKFWIYEKIDAEAHNYGISIDHGGDVVEAMKSGTIEIPARVIKETEKAVQVEIAATKLNRSMSGTEWKSWIPKSQIIA